MNRQEFAELDFDVTFEHFKDRLLYWINKNYDDHDLDEIIEFNISEYQPGILDQDVTIDYVGYNEDDGTVIKETIMVYLDDFLDVLYF